MQIGGEKMLKKKKGRCNIEVLPRQAQQHTACETLVLSLDI